MFNGDLADKVLAQIIADPETWNQRAWATETECGTAYCFGGWAVKLGNPTAEFEFDFPDDDSVEYVSIPGSRTPIGEYAAQLLNLSWTGDGNPLFHWSNSLDDLIDLVAQLKSGHRISYEDRGGPYVQH